MDRNGKGPRNEGKMTGRCLGGCVDESVMEQERKRRNRRVQ